MTHINLLMCSGVLDNPHLLMIISFIDYSVSISTHERDTSCHLMIYLQANTTCSFSGRIAYLN